MSLFGRNLIDRIKHSVSHRLTLPVPPYQSPAYWEKVYSQLGENDVFEWGDLSFESDLKKFTYKTSDDTLNEIKKVYSEKILSIPNTNNNNENKVTADFHDALFHECSLDDEEKSILVLGCGNSRLGEDILHYYLDTEKEKIIPRIPKIIQCDISTHVVNSMTKRYHKYIEKDQMSVIQDDATSFTLVNDETMDAVVDKGLVDALFCADRPDMMVQIMNSVHHKLKLGRVFIFFSFSKPEYLLKHTRKQQGTSQDILISQKHDDDVKWQSVDVWELDQIFLYRFVKCDTSPTNEPNPKIEKKKKFKRVLKKKTR